MASIKKRGNKFAVVYKYTNENGETKQKWESGFLTEEDAKIRKLEIELEQAQRTFITPSNLTLEQYLMQRWVPTYSKQHWGLSMYTSSVGLIKNHVLPHLGDRALQSLTPMDFEQLFSTLSVTEKGTFKQGIRVKPPKPDDFDLNMDVALNPSKYLSSSTLNDLYDVLKPAFSCAVEWKLLRENPLPKDAPKKSKVMRTIWDDGTMKEVLSKIHDPLLHLGIHLAFVCSLRNGEAVSITLDCIHLKNMVIDINKTLERVEFEALRAIPQKGIIRIFPNKFPNKKSCLVLKGAKTEASIRSALITEPLAHEIYQRIQQIERDKKLLGDKYHDYNLLFCLENGDPIEPQLMMKWFDKWQRKVGEVYPRIVFHGVRHSATTYKMALSEGDVKSVQGDGGWATMEMLDVYTRVQEARRRSLSKKLQADFYGIPESTEEKEPQAQEIPLTSKADVQSLILEMLQDPAMKQTVLMALLASNAQTNNG